MAADPLPTAVPRPRSIPNHPDMAALLSRPTHELHALARSPYWRKLVGLRILLARAEACVTRHPDPCTQAHLARLRDGLAWVEDQILRLASHTHGPAEGALFCHQCGLAHCDWPQAQAQAQPPTPRPRPTADPATD